MFRSLFAALVVSLVAGCGPADSVAGRCTADAQCPVGASCDETIGVCVVGTSATQGASGSSQTNAALPSGYGRYCETNAECGDVAGTQCIFNECIKRCSNDATCSSGTVCGGNNGTFGCFQQCSNSPCLNSGACAPAPSGPAEGQFICYPKIPASLGGKCSTSGDCRSELSCMKNSTHPEGYCSKACTTNADCYNGFDACIVVAGTTSGICMPKCAPSGAGMCREGTTCSPVSGTSYGVCY